MADFSFSDVASKIEPPKGMTLGEMLNMARGVQAYQQAGQINPLALRQQQAETEFAEQAKPLKLRQEQATTKKAESTVDAEIEQKIAESQKSLVGLNSEQLKNAREQMANSSRNLLELLGKPVVTSEDIKNHVLKTLKDAKASPQAIELALQNLPQGGTTLENKAFIAKHATNSLSAEAAMDKLLPPATMVSEGGYLTPRSLSNEMLTGPKPGTAVGEKIQVSPAPGTTTVNGVVGQYDQNGNFVPLAIQPQKEQITSPQAPKATIAPATPEKATKEPANKTPSLVHLDEPMSRGQLNEQEKNRYTAGEEDWKVSGERAQIARDSSLAARQIKRSLSATAGSKAGQIVRDTGQMFFGNSELDTLVKNLAEQQVRQASLMGLKSVSAEQDLKTANGSDKITNEALAHIVERAEATNLAAEKYNQASAKLQDKYGKTKAYINNDNFKKAWSENYDPIAFIIQNTNRQNIPQKDKDTIIDYYTSNMSQSDLNDLSKRMKNLKRLERGDL